MKRSFKIAAFILAMSIAVLTACGNEVPEKEESIPEESVSGSSNEETKENEPITAEPSSKEEAPAPVAEPAQEPAPAPAPAPEKPKVEERSGIRPEFKKALDEYEEFYNEYCDFMRKYENSDDTLGMLADYTRFLTQLAEMGEALDALGEEEMNNEELKYYIEVTGRIQQNLASLL